ncbi:hypothetical protein [Arthrobacter zhaoguopingii]|uniref:hypothetical protein n=1 Tax=Arthrobacter zhaoguopingii TaxID=2681491 RepID=UPI001359BADF|nr:hypothetical protein [Arthrobacter zhaoguopingii]
MTAAPKEHPGPDSGHQPSQRRTATGSGGPAGPAEPAGVVLALCQGHRCAALTKASGDGGLAAAVASSSGAVLITAACLQQCARGAVAAVALRTSPADRTGPSLWLGGLDAAGHLESLAHWVERWEPTAGPGLPEELRGTELGIGPPIRLTPAQDNERRTGRPA